VLANPIKQQSEIIVVTMNSQKQDKDAYVHFVRFGPNGFERDEDPKKFPYLTDLSITNEGTLLAAYA
jgi:hypothetical protein